MQASIDQRILGEKHVYFIIKVAECSNETRIDGDPECAPQAQVDDWLSDKYL
jgi:hypothetical protein